MERTHKSPRRRKSGGSLQSRGLVLLLWVCALGAIAYSADQVFVKGILSWHRQQKDYYDMMAEVTALFCVFTVLYGLIRSRILKAAGTISSVRLFLGAYGVSSGGDGRHLPDLPDPVGRIFLQRYFKAEGVRWNCCLFSGRLSSCNSDLLSDVGCGNRRYRRFTDFCHSQRYPSDSPAVYAAWERR